jgi:hypothetical protein
MFNAIENITFTESFWSDDDVTPYLSHLDRATVLRNQIVETLEQGGLAVAPALMLKLAKATEIAELWFLRIDIMQALSLQQSEEQARSTMGHITSFFIGLMPESVFTPSQYAIRTQNLSRNVGAPFAQPAPSLLVH